MDEDRRTRFLVAPLLFFASLAWGIIQDGRIWEIIHCNQTWEIVHCNPTFVAILQYTERIGRLLGPVTSFSSVLAQVVALLTVGGIAVFAVGYVIGTCSYVFLRVLFVSRWRHEMHLSPEALQAVWDRIGAVGQADQTRAFFAGETFVQGVLQHERKGVHQWLTRRWNAVSLAVTSVTGLGLSLLVGHHLGIKGSPGWGVPVGVVGGVLILAAWFAWRDYMGMVSFQAQVARPNWRPPQLASDSKLQA